MPNNAISPPYPEGVKSQSPGARSAPWDRDRTLSSYPEGVKSQSPGSRSAPWDRNRTPRVTPKGLNHLAARALYNPFGVNAPFACLPRVRCATLGFETQPLRG